MELVFWFSFATIFYSYFGYPLLLMIWTRLFPRPGRHNGDGTSPSVTMVVSAFNEEKSIKNKLDNSLKLDYPREKLQIVVVSDGSTDRTDEIVSEYSEQGVELLRIEERAGKTNAQNKAVEKASGDIIVFSDANAMYEPEAISELVKHFSDRNVGCVCGELVYHNNSQSAAGAQEGFYWTYERNLKQLEDRFGSILGANGSIYAIRREYYVPLSPELISDLIEPLKMIEKGYRTVYEPKAKSFEEVSNKFADEFNRKKRIILRSLYSLKMNRSLIDFSVRPRISFQLISHKVIRWLAPLLFIASFVTNMSLRFENSFYETTLWLQLAFYMMAFWGYVTEKSSLPRISVLNIPFYVTMVNAAALLALLDFISGKNVVLWSPKRQ